MSIGIQQNPGSATPGILAAVDTTELGKAFLNKPDWTQSNSIWKLEMIVYSIFKINHWKKEGNWKEDKRKEKRKEGKKGKKKEKGEEIMLFLGPLKVRLHSEPSEREARTTCERPLKKNNRYAAQNPKADPDKCEFISFETIRTVRWCDR